MSAPAPSGGASASSSTSANKKADQIVHRFYLKAALLLAQARESHVQPPPLPSSSSGAGDRGAGGAEESDREGGRGRKPDKWFNIETPDTPPPSLAPLLAAYRTLSASPTPPAQLTILTLLLIPPLAPSQLLVLHPPPPSPSSSTSSTNSSRDAEDFESSGGPQVLSPSPRAIVLERWTIDLIPLSASQSSLPSPPAQRTAASPPYPAPMPPGGEDEPLQRVYKRGISLFRAHFQLLRQMPAWGCMRKLRAGTAGGEAVRGGYTAAIGGRGGARGRRGAEDGMGGLRMVLRREGEERGVLDFDALATLVSPSPRTATHRLSPVPTPHGQLNIACTYLSHPNFALANKESLLSANFMTQDRRAASRSQQRRHAPTVAAGGRSYDEMEESTLYPTNTAAGGDDGLADPLPPSLARFSSSPDTAARLVAQAHGGGAGSLSLGSSPGSLSLRAQAALHASQSRQASVPSSLQAQQLQPSREPQGGSMYASSSAARGDRRPDSPTSPPRLSGSPRNTGAGGYFASLPSSKDLPFAVPSSSSSPSPSLSLLREREHRERERKASLVSLASGSGSSLDLPQPLPLSSQQQPSNTSLGPQGHQLPPSQPRRPSLNAPHPFKPPDPGSASSGSPRLGGLTALGAGPGGGSTTSLGSSSHPSHPPSPLAAYAPRQLPFPTSSTASISGGGGAGGAGGGGESALAEPGTSSGGGGGGAGGERPPIRGTRYSSSFSHRYSSGSNTSTGALSGGAGGGAAAPGTSPVPIAIRSSGTGTGTGTGTAGSGSPSLLARSLSQSLSQSQLAGSGGSYGSGSRGGLAGPGSYGSRASFGGREGAAGPAGAERERAGRVESVPEGSVPSTSSASASAVAAGAAGAAGGGGGGGGSLGGSALGSLSGSGSGGSGSGPPGTGSAEAVGRGGGRRYSSSFGQRRPVLATAGSSASGASAGSGSSGIGVRGGSAGSTTELAGLARPGLGGSPSPSSAAVAGPLPQRAPAQTTPQVDDPDLQNFLHMLDSGPRLSGSPGGSGFIAGVSSSPRPSSLSTVSLASQSAQQSQSQQRSGSLRTPIQAVGQRQEGGSRDAQIRALEERFDSSLNTLSSSPSQRAPIQPAAQAGPSGISRLRSANLQTPALDPFAQDDDDAEPQPYGSRGARPRGARTASGSDELVVGRLEQGEGDDATPGAGAGAGTGGRGWRRVPTD